MNYAEDNVRARIKDFLKSLLVEKFVKNFNVNSHDLESNVVALDLNFITLGEILVNINNYYFSIRYSKNKGASISVCTTKKFPCFSELMFIPLFTTKLDNATQETVVDFFEFIEEVFWYDGGIIKLYNDNIHVKLRYSSNEYNSYNSYIKDSMKLRLN